MWKKGDEPFTHVTKDAVTGFGIVDCFTSGLTSTAARDEQLLAPIVILAT